MRKTAVAFLAGSAILALAGCAGTTTAGSADSTVTYALSADPGSLNPITNATVGGQQLSLFAYESLMLFEADADPVGLIADTWTETSTQVSFVLKDDVTCSDGTELTPSDVKASFEYAGAEETASPFAGVYFPETGLTVTADDATNTVTFDSEDPQSFLLQTIGNMPIVCAAGIANPDSLETSTAGTGPYILESASAGQTYTYTLRDDYESGANGVTSTTEGLPATFVAEVVTTAATQVNMLSTGELNLAEIGGTDRDRLDESTFTAVDVPARPGQIFFNQAAGRPGNSLEVRQAIAQAIDRQAVADVSTSGRGELMVNLVSSLSSVCLGTDSSASIPAYDVEAAEALLDAAGWIAGTDGMRSKDGTALTLSLLYPASEGAGVTAAIELIQQQLAVVGIAATPAPAASYTDVIFQGGDWDLAWAPISADLPSVWAGVLSGDFPPDGGNWTYNTNQEYFDLTAEAQTLAGDASCDSWLAAQDSLFSDLEVLPIAESTSTIYGASVEFAVSTNGLVLPTTLKVTE